MGSTFSPDTQRYIIQASDVLSDHRLTVAPLADPSTVIWYTERYLAHPASGPAEIVENIVHQPTNTICWSVHRPTNIRRQGWYVRLRSPLFPPGVSIPLQPVSSTSPYYVDGALSFKCRTNNVSKPPMQRLGPPGVGLGRPGSRTSVSSNSSASSSSPTVHSYPPTPAASPPPPPADRRELPPLRIPGSTSSTQKSRSLTKEQNPDIHVIGIDDHDNDDHFEDVKTPTSAFTITRSSINDPANGSKVDEHPISPPASLNGKGKQLLQPTEDQPGPSNPNGRAPRPPAIPLSTISEFILIPLSEASNMSSGSFVNLTASPIPASSAEAATQPGVYPHSHHRTYSSSYSTTAASRTPTNGAQGNRSSGLFGKALNTLKSSLPAALSTTITSTMQGNSFTITRIPEVRTGDIRTGNGAISPPPAYTSTANLLVEAGPSSSQSYAFKEPPPSSGTGVVAPPSAIPSPWTSMNAISSTSFVQPLPPPLLNFMDETSLFGAIPFGLGSLSLGLFKHSSTSSNSRQSSRASLQPAPRMSPLPTHTVSPSLPAEASTSSSHFSETEPRRGTPNPNYTTLGTVTVSKSQLAALGVDTAFWITCALVFWGYLEEREGYLSAIDD